MLITRSLQEWACLLGSEVPFETATRLLCWSCQEEKLLSATEVRRLVCIHGKCIRQQEAKAIEVLLEQERDPQAQPDLSWVPTAPPRRPTAWPTELRQAVETALDQPGAAPPAGVSRADWDRVLAARREEPGLGVDALARLGPRVAEGQVVASVDDVLVREPEEAHFLAIHTARIVTAHGARYLSGGSAQFLVYLGVLLRLCARCGMTLTLLADGQAWISTFYHEMLRSVTSKAYLLDWFHLRKKCRLLTSSICRGRQARAQLLKGLLGTLFRGDVFEAVQMLEDYRPQAKNVQVLDQLLGYLQSRKEWIVDYRQRRQHRQYIGSGHAEKANDLIVARRQKRRGMHWREASSDGLAALRTLLLNQEWDSYWRIGSPLSASA